MLAFAASIAVPADARLSGVPRAERTVRVVRVVRIPLSPIIALPVPRPAPRWRESRAPRCIRPDRIAGATFNGPSSLDFLLRDGLRIRAKLGRDCAGIDYYSGFYLKPGGDGQVCEDRDAVHARSGGACGIDAFRRLKARADR